ncbi:MAG: hypothetical protein JW891_09135 [Candidatus Lokiarchaeota archaeon]|nr:hypothetical protein [Candidatus Lokiarchaeota archaeon]
MWRHGDVIIEKIKKLPEGLSKKKTHILVKGEITGHAHRFQDPRSVQLWEDNGALFFEVLEPSASLIHEEHNTIEFKKGTYLVKIQREYTPKEIVRIRD